MRELRKPDGALQRILPPQKLLSEGTYVRSRYALPYECNGKKLWFSTLTKQLVETEHPLLERANADEVNHDAELAALVKGYYLVPEGKDELTFYMGLFRILHALAMPKGVRGYTILPTSVCNARCVYCFEEGRPQQTMTPEVIEATVRYILEHRGSDEIHIQWFGGEPLAAIPVIDAICGKLKAAEVTWNSSITTNGSLITETVADKMAGEWNVKHAQVSMDGDEGDYIARKRYVSEGDHYHATLQGIRLLSERGVSVAVRCNVDEENMDTVPAFLADLSAAVPDKENVDVYLSALNQARMGENGLAMWERVAESRELLRSFGFSTKDSRFSLHALRNRHCMADMGSVVITADGGLYPCEHCPPESRFGSVLEDAEDTEARERFCRVDRVREMCRDCAFLPCCTPFAACPIQEKRCGEIRRFRTFEQIRDYLENKDRETEDEDPFSRDC